MSASSSTTPPSSPSSTSCSSSADSVSQYEAAGRQDLADAERFEIEILAAYLPEKMSSRGNRCRRRCRRRRNRRQTARPTWAS
jgi:hypothetical protein